MFGKSKGRKALESAAEPVLKGLRETAAQNESKNSDRDATLLFVGWFHYAVTYLLSARQMSPNDIVPATAAAAVAVRKISPNHNLGVSYLEVGMHRIREALSVPGAFEGGWVSHYYDAAKGEISIDDSAFCGALLREALAVHQIPDLRVR